VIHSSDFPAPGKIISYLDMGRHWSVSFQRGIHFQLRPDISVILMSRRKNAPYKNAIEPGGLSLRYAGHDIPKNKDCPNPKIVDQPRQSPGGSLTQNELFEKAALANRVKPPEIIAVYEKIHRGIWAFNGFFHFTDCTFQSDGTPKVFQFRLELANESPELSAQRNTDLSDTINIVCRQARSADSRQRCMFICGSKDNLHFDHDLPYSKVGSALISKNIRLLCARHNLAKHDKIE
jgi:hypothetical protein